MPPIWNPEEESSSVYKNVENHSEGMISFAYHPADPDELELLKNTETYRNRMAERLASRVDEEK